MMQQKERLEKQLDFIREIDKEKEIFRQTYLADASRKENDAEHAWHMAIMTMLLSEYANEKIDVVCQYRCQIVFDLVGAELNLVIFLKVESEPRVVEGKEGGGIVGAIDGSRSLHQQRGVKRVLGRRIFVHRDVEIAVDALSILELHVRPTALVEELFQGGFQVLKDGSTRSLHLRVIDVHSGVQLLCL